MPPPSLLPLLQPAKPLRSHEGAEATLHQHLRVAVSRWLVASIMIGFNNVKLFLIGIFVTTLYAPLASRKTALLFGTRRKELNCRHYNLLLHLIGFKGIHPSIWINVFRPNGYCCCWQCVECHFPANKAEAAARIRPLFSQASTLLYINIPVYSIQFWHCN